MSNERGKAVLNDKYVTVTDASSREYLIVSLKGRMVYETSDTFSQQLVKEVKDKQQYVVDVNDLEKVDSTGLGVLITFAKKVQAAGGQVAFAVNKKFLQDIFKMAKFDYIFPVASNQEEAWQALKNGYQSKMTLTSY